MADAAAIDPAGAARERRCPLCDGAEARALPKASRDEWRVVGCTGCDFVYLANPPGFGSLEEEFAWEQTFEDEKARRIEAAPLVYRTDYATRRLRAMFRPDEARRYRRWFGEGGKVLDVGCADGARVGSPFTPYGIEVSVGLWREADRRMRALGGYCVQAPGSEGIWRFPEAEFDGILMRSYLEHEEAPRRVLAGARRALKPAGRVYVKVPNYGSLNRRVMGRTWCGFRHPDHVNYFTAGTLRRMAAAEGFETSILNKVNLALDDNIHALIARA